MHDSSICNLYYRINWCKVAFKVMLSWSTHSEIMNMVPEYFCWWSWPKFCAGIVRELDCSAADEAGRSFVPEYGVFPLSTSGM